MKKYRIAAILMIIHGGFMEIGGALCMIPCLLLGADNFAIGQYFSFIVPFFDEHLFLMVVMGAIYGIIRVIGAIGLWKNRMWGFVLSVTNCITTMVLMMFMLPAGVMDGILACTSFILMLLQYFGDRKIIED